MTDAADTRYIVRPERLGNYVMGWLVLDKSRGNTIVKRFGKTGMMDARHEAARRNWQAAHR